MSSPALIALTTFLTRPLVFAGAGAGYTPLQILTLQSILQVNLAPWFPNTTTASLTQKRPSAKSFIFTLSSNANHIPAPFVSAANTAGVALDRWMSALGLSSMAELYFLVSPIAVKVGVTPAFVKDSTIVLWEDLAEAEKDLEAKEVVSISSRPRAATATALRLLTPGPIRLPTLPSLTTSPSSDSSDSDSESDSDADSIFSSDSDSNESLTSVSSAASERKCVSPVSIPTVHRIVSVPKTTARTAPIPVTKPAKPAVTEYMYAGGKTGVASGRVMLGSASKAAPIDRPFVTKPQPRPRTVYTPSPRRRTPVLLAPESRVSNWRRV